MSALEAIIDEELFQSHLLEARRDLSIEFDASEHPRDLVGRFRKGMKVKLLSGDIAQVTSVDAKKGTIGIKHDGREGSYMATGAHPLDEKPPRPKSVKSRYDAAIWGIHHGTSIDIGESLDGSVGQEIVGMLHKMKKEHPEVYKQVSSIRAASVVAGTEGRSVRDHMNSRPKTVMTTKSWMGSTSIFLNDLHRAEELNAGDMRALTNPAKDKLVSPAHAKLGGIVAHEIGHAWYDNNTDVARRSDELFKELGKSWLRKNLSYRAGESAQEMAAEVFALRVTGHPVPAKLKRLTNDT